MAACETYAEARTAIAAVLSVNYYRRHRLPDSLINFPGTLKLCGVRNRRLPLCTSGCRTTLAAATHNRDIYIIGHSGNWRCEPLTAAMRDLADRHLSANESRIQNGGDSGHPTATLTNGRCLRQFLAFDSRSLTAGQKD